MGSFIEEILKSATAGKTDSGVLGSVIEAAKEKMGEKSPGGLGDIIGQLGLGGGKPDLGNIGDIAKSVINVIGLAQGALGDKK